MNNQVINSAFLRVPLAVAITVAEFISLPMVGAVPPPQFGPPTSFPVGNYPHSLVVADFNRDDNLDIVVIAGAGVNFLPGLGNGDFAVRTNVFSSPCSDVAVGDFNNDRNLDLVVGIAALLGDGSGSFLIATNHNPLSDGYLADLTTGDFNGDANLDIAVTEGFYRTALLVFGRGDGSFSGAWIILTNAADYIRAGDINQDGRPDLVVGGGLLGFSNRVYVLTNKGDGTFATSPYYDAPGRPQGAELADLNRDGSLDLTLLGAASVTIRLNNGAGAFGPPTDCSLGFSPTDVALGDFNGDGTVDLLVRRDAAATILSGHGDGSFTVGAPMSFPSASIWYHTIAAGDLNGDGTPDIACLDHPGAAVAVMLNQTPPLLQLTPMPGYNQLSWLRNFGAGYSLEYTTNLAQPATWHPFPYPPVVIGNQKAVTDWEDRPGKFYRLRKPS